MLPGDRVLGRFEVVRALVQGADRPSTLRVRDLEADRSAILKIVRSDAHEGDPLLAEVDLLRAIAPEEARSAQIAPLIDSGHDDGLVWMLTEDVGDLDASQWFRRRASEGVDRLGHGDALDLLEALATSLSTLHRHRVLHLDVKEANVVVDRAATGPGRFWLVDLGIGRALREGRSTATADFRGTLEGVAPELLHPSRQVGPPADVYSACCVVLRGLRDRPQARWPQELGDQLAACGLRRDPRHVALLRLLLRGLDERAGRRPSAAELARRVRAIRAGRVWHRGRLKPLVAIAPLVLVAALVVVRDATAPPLTFEDATRAWGLAAPAPDPKPVPGVDGRSSGFYWNPSVLTWPSRGELELYVPRGLRRWGETSDDLRRDLLARFVDGRFRWTIAGNPGAEDDTNRSIEVDLDGDGHLDRLVIGFVPSGDSEHHAWFGPEPWSGGRHSPGLAPGDCFPAEPSTPDRVPGFPLVVPPELGDSRPRLLTTKAERRCLATWTPERLRSRPLQADFDRVLTWVDLDADGLLDLLVRHGQVLRSLSRRPDGSWEDSPVGAAGVGRPYAVPGDLDGDGDEDLVALTADRSGIMALINERGRLVQRELPGIQPLGPGELNSTSLSTLRLTDLDADGLPELLVQSCGFSRRGAASPKVFRNLGGLAFEQVPLPPPLGSPHDGSPFVVVDVDGDGLPDLLDLSINDEHREIPTHRGWRTVSRSDDRLWPLDVRLPNGGALPVGTRLQAIGERPWLHVVRDGSPPNVPSWLSGTLLVQLPTGLVHVLELTEPPGAPREAILAPVDPPTLLAAGGAPIGAGVPAPGSGKVHYHARRGGLDIRLERGETGGVRQRIVIAADGAERVVETGSLRVGLGCWADDRCLFMEADPTGGLTPLRLNPISGRVERLPEVGDMTLGAQVQGDRAWVAADHELRVRDPHTYALLGRSPDYDNTLGECRSLVLSGARLACAMAPVSRLLVYDVDTLAERSRAEVALASPWSVVPVDGGWAVSTEDGMAWVDDDGRVDRLRLGEPLSLVASDGVLWAVGRDRAFWIDPLHRRVQGGLVAPGVGATWPTGPEGEHGIR